MTACGFVWPKVFNLAELRGGGVGWMVRSKVWRGGY